MNIVICGAGQVGYSIAESLSSDQNDVSVIDSQPKLINKIRDSLNVKAFVGHGSHPNVLERAGADKADVIIAVTLHDEVNMIACQVAHSLFRTPTKIARIRAQKYLEDSNKDMFVTDHMPIDVVISPEIEVGKTVLRRLEWPGAVDISQFFEDRVFTLGIQCQENCPVVDTPLKQLTELFPDLEAVVVGIVRNSELFVPKSGDALLQGDLVYVVCHRDQITRTLGLFGHEEPEAVRVIIAGGGNIGLYVAQEFERPHYESKVRVKIIEASQDRSIEIADALKRTIVLNGSALDQDLLREADTQDADTLIALTNDDKVNILSGVMAKKMGSKRNMALINDRNYHEFANAMGIDAYVNPRDVTISRILQYVRMGRVRGVTSIQNGAAELIEAEALDTSPLVGAPLKEVDLPNGVRIGAILRDNEVMQPSGDFIVRKGDRIVMFVLAECVQEIQRLFRVSLYYF